MKVPATVSESLSPRHRPVRLVLPVVLAAALAALGCARSPREVVSSWRSGTADTFAERGCHPAERRGRQPFAAFRRTTPPVDPSTDPFLDPEAVRVARSGREGHQSGADSEANGGQGDSLDPEGDGLDHAVVTAGGSDSTSRHDGPDAAAPGVAVERNETFDSQLERLRAVLNRDEVRAEPVVSGRESLEEVRRRVDELMQEARHELERGQLERASRIAMTADALAEGLPLLFGPDDEQPGDLVRLLRDRLAEEADGPEESLPAPGTADVERVALTEPRLRVEELAPPPEEPARTRRPAAPPSERPARGRSAASPPAVAANAPRAAANRPPPRPLAPQTASGQRRQAARAIPDFDASPEPPDGQIVAPRPPVIVTSDHRPFRPALAASVSNEGPRAIRNVDWDELASDEAAARRRGLNAPLALGAGLLLGALLVVTWRRRSAKARR